MVTDLGSDIAGVISIDYTLSVVDGKLALAHALLRRITTPRGGLIGDSTYGYNVHDLIGSAVPVSVIEQRVLEQMLAEEQVDDARCTVTRSSDKIRIEINIVLSDASSFDLVLTDDTLTVEAFLDGQLILQEAA